MLILAGIASGAGLWYYSETFRLKTRQAGMTVAWYGMRAYTQIEMCADDVLERISEWAGWTPQPEMDEPETEMIHLHNKELAYVTQRTRMADGKSYVRVGSQNNRESGTPQLCSSSMYAPVIRVRKTSGKLQSYPVDFDGDEYCLVGNVLFDPAFVAYWLRTRFQYELEDSDTWQTSFIGRDMVTQIVSQLQKAVCYPECIRVENVDFEEPAQGDGDTSPAREPWILDLNGKNDRSPSTEGEPTTAATNNSI